MNDTEVNLKCGNLVMQTAKLVEPIDPRWKKQWSELGDGIVNAYLRSESNPASPDAGNSESDTTSQAVNSLSIQDAARIAYLNDLLDELVERPVILTPSEALGSRIEDRPSTLVVIDRSGGLSYLVNGADSVSWPNDPDQAREE